MLWIEEKRCASPRQRTRRPVAAQSRAQEESSSSHQSLSSSSHLERADENGEGITTDPRRHHHDQPQNNAHYWTTGTFKPPPPRLVQVLPGSEMEFKFPPPEPIEPPPIPSQILKFLVIGEPQSGKTALIKRFLYRQPLQQGTTPATTTTTTTVSSVEYHKKDLSYWYNQTQFHCVRVQLWDVSSAMQQGDGWDNNFTQRAESLGIVLVVSMEHNGYEALVESIQKWKQWLDAVLGKPLPPPPVTLFLNKHDLLVNQQPLQPPSAWIRLGSNLSTLCHNLGIVKWHLTSCCIDDNGVVEDAFMDLIKRASASHTTPTLVSRGKEQYRKGDTGYRQVTTPHAIVEAQAVPIHSFASSNKDHY